MTPTRAFGPLILTALSALPAAAECFDQSDLARGIVVRFENGDFTTMRRMNDGYQEIVEHYVDGANPVWFRAHRGIYFVGESELDADGRAIPGTRLEITFSTDPATLPDAVPGTEWEGPTVNLFETGDVRNEVTSVRFVAAPDITLSGCTYEVVRTELRYDWGPDGGLSLVYRYLPALGTAIILTNQFDGNTLNTTTPVAIELATK